MKNNTHKHRFLSSVAAHIISIFHKSPPKVTTADLRRTDFETSTQRIGVIFTERIRNVFRFRWIKKT